MSMLKLKINVNLPQLLCIVVSAAQMANLSDLVGFSLTLTTRYKKETRVESSFLTSLKCQSSPALSLPRERLRAGDD